MNGTFLIGSKCCNITLCNDGIEKCMLEKNDTPMRIKYKSILKVKTQQLDGESKSSLEIWYVHKPGPTKWELKQLQLVLASGQDLTDIGTWATYLHDKIKEFPRPKSLLVIVNPTSGGGKGRTVYQKVSKIFKTLDIQLDVLFTERSDHAVEYISGYNLATIDGIACIGGDGTYAECVQGLLSQAQKEAGIDPNDPEAILAASNIPIGVIPAGTGNGIAMVCVGQIDVVSSALHIAIGNTIPTNAMAVHSNGHMIRYGILLTGYSMFSDAIANSESKRWMGRGKYIWGLGKMFVDMKTVDVNVDALVNGEWIHRSGCYLGTTTFASDIFAQGDLSFGQKQKGDGDTKPSDSKNSPVSPPDGATCGITEHAEAAGGDIKRAPICGTHDGFYLGLVKPTKRINFIKFLKRMYRQELEHPSLKPFLENFYNVSVVKVEHIPHPDGSQLEDRVYNINIDGDLHRLDGKPACEMRNHQNLVKLYCARD